MGIDIELFVPVERNRGKETGILEGIIRSRGISTYEIDGGNITINHPGPSVDYSKLEGEERHQAELADRQRPGHIAVRNYNIHLIAVRQGFIRAGLMERWKSFFTDVPARMRILKNSLEIARSFSSRHLYLVPGESGYYCFKGVHRTRKGYFQIALRHPDLVTVTMRPDLLYRPAPDAEPAEMFTMKTSPRLMMCLAKRTEP